MLPFRRETSPFVRPLSNQAARRFSLLHRLEANARVEDDACEGRNVLNVRLARQPAHAPFHLADRPRPGGSRIALLGDRAQIVVAEAAAKQGRGAQDIDRRSAILPAAEEASHFIQTG
jgi:hypothetical protein